MGGRRHQGASALPAHQELMGSHPHRELSDKAMAWMPPASPCILRLQHLPASSGKLVVAGKGLVWTSSMCQMGLCQAGM